MSAGARVSATGSMAADEPWHRAASLGVQKAGLRNLVISLDRTLEPDGIRAVSVTVRGTLSSEGTFTPDKVAAAILAASSDDEGSLTSRMALAVFVLAVLGSVGMLVRIALQTRRANLGRRRGPGTS